MYDSSCMISNWLFTTRKANLVIHEYIAHKPVSTFMCMQTFNHFEKEMWLFLEVFHSNIPSKIPHYALVVIVAKMFDNNACIGVGVGIVLSSQ